MSDYKKPKTKDSPTVFVAESPIMEFFKYAHLPESLQKVSKSIGDVAKEMESLLPAGAEKSAGLRKLLEAKDCFVRASLKDL